MNTVKFSELCTFQPKQIEATKAADEHRFTFFGGSRGPGKSHWLRWYALRELFKLAKAGIKQPIVGLFSEDYPTLTDRQLTKIKTEFPDWLGELKDSKVFGLAFHLREEYGGGVLMLRNLDDPSKYQSAEFALIAVEEITKNAIETFDLLRGSLRWKGVARPKFICAGNPGGKGHAWVKQLWIDRQFPKRFQELAPEFCFVPALPTDNKFLSESYWEDLKSQPERLRKAWLNGDWDAFEGQFFSTFDPAKEIIEPFAIPPEWRLIASLDPGQASPCSFGLTAIDFEKNVYRIQTYYESELSGVQHVSNIKRFIAKNKYTGGRTPQYITAGLDAWARKDRYALLAHERTLADLFSDEGMPLTKAITDRIPGWWAWKNLMPSRYFVFGKDPETNSELNKPLLDEILAVVADEREPEDIQGRGNDPKVGDHALDESRYSIMSALDVAKPKELEVTARDRDMVDYEEITIDREAF